MSKSDRNARDLKEWEQTAVSIAANAPDLPQTEIPRAALVRLTDELRKHVVDQKLFQANKQTTSQRMAEIHSEGNRLVTILRAMVKHHYGIRNEKLVELGVKVFRGRVRKAAAGPAPEVPTTPTPPAAK
jgi:hypothetical protein